jgi:dihydrofolate synthase/folylpolyglutamate synthase
VSDYAAALARLAALARFGVRPGLEPIARVLAALGHPEQKFPSLHVAGTNGKGSVAAIAERTLRAAGARTGLYTSPHLSRFTERIRVDGEEIANERTAQLIDRVLAAEGGDQLTFFEVATAAAFLHFADEKVDLAVIEVGLGGRLDATNLCRPFACAISSIGLDHTAELGPTTGAIAVEKAGIAKPGVPLFVGPVDADARASIARVAREQGAPVSWFPGDFSAILDGESLDYQGPGGALAGAKLALAGAHQAGNAAIALAASSLAGKFAPDERARRIGLAEVRWPGRLERVAPWLLLDAAHNPEGAQALARALPAGDFTLLVGALADKDVRGVLAHLVPRAAHVICTHPSSPRALDATALAALARELSPTAPIEAIADPKQALAAARAHPPVIAAGSIFLVGELRRLVLGETTDPLPVADPLAQKL